LAKNTDTANHPLIRKNYPLLTQAIVAGASGQLRNMATNGGNLMQRTRCQYFYDTSMPCNKREPGTGCGALEGLNRIHAIIGWSDKCVATYPGDMANALHALEAVVRVKGADGRERTIPIGEFHRLPGDTPERDNNLQHGELIVAIDLPRSPFAMNSYYLKVRDRASYAFALVAVAAALEKNSGAIRQARVVLYGRIMNPNLQHYHVPVNADVHEIETIFVEEDDRVVNALGVKGMGELGMVGIPAAIANAVFHATGRRIRELPITPDKLL
jgi:xanthine dehydrogenase YagS FAD-binding subunit